MKQSTSPPFTPMRQCQYRRWFFTVHVSSSTDAPTLCALLAFVTTPETQKKTTRQEENKNRDIPTRIP
jgi:hypothetical protein